MDANLIRVAPECRAMGRACLPVLRHSWLRLLFANKKRYKRNRGDSSLFDLCYACRVVPRHWLAEVLSSWRCDRDCSKERSWDGLIFTAVGFATKIICCKQRVSRFIPDKGVVATK
jgi:hypothetical protein